MQGTITVFHQTTVSNIFSSLCQCAWQPNLLCWQQWKIFLEEKPCTSLHMAGCLPIAHISGQFRTHLVPWISWCDFLQVMMAFPATWHLLMLPTVVLGRSPWRPGMQKEMSIPSICRKLENVKEYYWGSLNKAFGISLCVSVGCYPFNLADTCDMPLFQRSLRLGAHDLVGGLIHKWLTVYLRRAKLEESPLWSSTVECQQLSQHQASTQGPCFYTWFEGGGCWVT